MLGKAIVLATSIAFGCGGAPKKAASPEPAFVDRANIDVCSPSWDAQREARCLMGTVRREVAQAELRRREVRSQQSPRRLRCIDDRIQTLRVLGELGAASRWRIGVALQKSDDITAKYEQDRLRLIHRKVMELGTVLDSC